MDQERENSLNPHPIKRHVVGSGLSKHEDLMSKLRQPIQSVPRETFLKVRDALESMRSSSATKAGNIFQDIVDKQDNDIDKIMVHASIEIMRPSIEIGYIKAIEEIEQILKSLVADETI